MSKLVGVASKHVVGAGQDTSGRSQTLLWA